MKKFLFAFAFSLFATPALATPERFPVVNPNEPMILVPGLHHVGLSRLSTVEHCQAVEKTDSWWKLITDSDFQNMESCLLEHT